MLPSRSTLRGWNPDALATSAGAVGASADQLAAAVKGIDSACGRMPETRAWEGHAHDAASAMFGRANVDATEFSEYAHAVTWPDGSTFTMSMDRTGFRNAGFTTAGGRHQAVPVELIDNMSLGAGSVLSGLEKHVQRGGGLPMLTAQSVDDIGKAGSSAGRRWVWRRRCSTW